MRGFVQGCALQVGGCSAPPGHLPIIIIESNSNFWEKAGISGLDFSTILTYIDQILFRVNNSVAQLEEERGVAAHWHWT